MVIFVYRKYAWIMQIIIREFGKCFEISKLFHKIPQFGLSIFRAML
mgnify:CR=1 FL=1